MRIWFGLSLNSCFLACLARLSSVGWVARFFIDVADPRSPVSRSPFCPSYVALHMLLAGNHANLKTESRSKLFPQALHPLYNARTVCLDIVLLVRWKWFIIFIVPRSILTPLWNRMWAPVVFNSRTSHIACLLVFP